MSCSSLRFTPEDELVPRNKKPEWVESFLEPTYDNSCSLHQIAPRNKNNWYCINCRLVTCKTCMKTGNHIHHNTIKLYRHIYKEAVRLTDMKQHIDCSSIQPYKNNSNLVIALHPLPHSGSVTDEGLTCKICKRKLMDPTKYHYCSISCKVEAFLEKKNSLEPPFLGVVPSKGKDKQVAKRGHYRRKGVPRRAPFN